MTFGGLSAVRERLMLAFEGTEIPADTLATLRDAPAAGFTLFRHLNVESPAQVRRLTIELQAANRNPLPLLIAADQEGGQLNAMGEETTQFAGNMALGATGDAVLAERIGRAIGTELRALGINVDYAPVCDVNTNPHNPSLGIRSFGDDPDLVASLAVAMVRGLQASGVAATVKHFPGKGDARVDSHYEMPVIEHDRQRLEAIEFLPFRRGLDAGARLVMSGHFALPALTTRSDLPSTLSGDVMAQFLRDDLGFEGVAITDALDMGAITQGVGQIIDVIAAMQAGIDLMLLTANPEAQERIEQGLALAMSRGLLDIAKFDRSMDRIAALRAWVGSFEQPDLTVVGSREHEELARMLAEQSITLVRNQDGLLPLRLGLDQRISAITPQPRPLTPADTSAFVKPSLASELRGFHPAVDELVVPDPPSDADIAEACRVAARANLVILGTVSASMNEAQAELGRQVLAVGTPTVTVAMRTPYDILMYPNSGTHICTYGILPPSMKALAAALFGKIRWQGRLPVEVVGAHKRWHGLSA